MGICDTLPPSNSSRKTTIGFPPKAGEVFVQYGCGWCAPEGWHNFDASPTLKFERIPLFGKIYTKNDKRFPESARIGNIVSGLPFSENSVDCVYASHVIEHLSYKDALRALRNTYTMLKPGGTFRVIVPDLNWRITAYLETFAAGDRQAGTMFMKSTFLGIEEHERGFFGWIKALFGHNRHLWMWDEPSLTDALKEVGFRAVRRCRFGDAESSAFSMVEEESRFFEGCQAELALEAAK